MTSCILKAFFANRRRSRFATVPDTMTLTEHPSSQSGPEAVLPTESLEKSSLEDLNKKLEALSVHDPETDKLDTTSIGILSKADLQGVPAQQDRSADGTSKGSTASAAEITDLQRFESDLTVGQDARPVKDLSTLVEPVHWAFVIVASCLDPRTAKRAGEKFYAMLEEISIWAQPGHVLNPPGPIKDLASTVT
jgi:hypothetical protein